VGLALLGRSGEQQDIDAVLGAARDGLSGVLVLEGDPGMGKTALLDYAVSSGEDFRVANVAGVHAESEFGYAALHRLLLPFVGGIDALPPRQRDALRAAFGFGASQPADRFIIALAVLSLMADAATRRPLLCVVDDAQWIDRESLDALTFVGRRLHADRIALFFALRPGSEVRPSFEGLPVLPIEGLGEDDAVKFLAATTTGPLDREVARKIASETRGSPLALSELAHDLDPAQLAGGDVLPLPLPISDRLESHYLRQVRELPAEAQTLLLLAAADMSGDAVVLRNAADVLALPATATDVPLARGLLELRPRVAFRHPLIRSAVYGGATGHERREVHRALAAASEGDPSRRAWHLAHAAVGPDESLAAEIERAGRLAHDHGRYGTEAAFLRLAAELTPDPSRRAERFLVAAQASLVVGSTHAAAALLGQARPDLSSPLMQAHAQRLDAALHSYALPGDTPRPLLDAARALEQLDPRLARDTYLQAIEASLVSAQLTRGTTPRAIAMAALNGPPRATSEPTTEDLLLEGFATRVAVGYVEAVPTLQEAIRRLRTEDLDAPAFSRSSVLSANAGADLWDADGYGAMLHRMEARERERGALDSLRITLGGLGHYEMWAGHFDRAELRHSEASDIASVLGESSAVWETLKVELFAWQGRDAETRSIVSLLSGELAVASGGGVAVNLALIAATILDLAQGHYADALEHAWKLYEEDVPPHGSQALAEIVEAGVRSGNGDAAAAALARLTERAEASGTPWALGLLARSQALVAEDDAAEALYRDAVARLGSTPNATDLARAHLLYGEWLRRQKRRQDARDSLRQAHDMFVAMGARAFAERAHGELAATGETSRRRSVETRDDLTPQEQQVARLAADGATNREIGAQLFISSATVDYHLRKIYRKLGVTSRRELRTATSAGARIA
jgi:DNA-binding CsgD family transcriptional regulator